MITRRGLLQGILAAGIAPAIVKAEILMPVRKIVLPEFGIGILTATDVQARQQEFNTQIAERMRLIEDMSMGANPPLVCRHRRWLVAADGQTITFLDTPMGVKEFQQLRMKGHA